MQGLWGLGYEGFRALVPLRFGRSTLATAAPLSGQWEK